MDNNGTLLEGPYQIIDPTSKKVRVVTKLTTKSHEIPNRETGETEMVKGVEMQVMFQNRLGSWPLWIEYDQFKEFNEEIPI